MDPKHLPIVIEKRQEGWSVREIAEELGITPRLLQSRITRWNQSNPRNKVPPRRKRASARYATAAEMLLAGKSRSEIAAAMDTTRIGVNGMLTTARKRGLLPMLTPGIERGGVGTYNYLYRKGAAPRIGELGHVIDALSAAEVQQLVNLCESTDNTVADLVTRVIKRTLDDARARRDDTARSGLKVQPPLDLSAHIKSNRRVA